MIREENELKRTEILERMGMRLPLRKQLRVIVSSDVRNEADDQFAVAHHLLTPMFDVRAVVAAHLPHGEGPFHPGRHAL